MRKIIMLIVLCFLVFSCELFNAQNDPDYWEKLDEEIAWVNAEKLTVSVTFPAEWGTSPNSGTGRSFDNVRRNETPRKGYAFNVEFTPLPGFGFEKWLAFPTSEYSKLDFSKNAADVLSDSLNGKSVEIIESTSDTGARVATVKVNTSAPVTLIPWCSNRPAVIQSNPPLISSGFAYTRGQPITIWFSTDLDNDGDAKIDFGENLIKITGQHISDGRAWNDPNTPVNEEGDLTGQKDGTFSYFEKPVYNPDTRIISINPNTTNYPPENLIITVTVGTGIKGANGSEMNIPVSFSYQTTDEIATIAYKANNVWAIHDPHSTQVNAFFYQMAPEDRDRRLRKNTQGNYQVTLYFSISRSMGEIENPTPEALTIAEIYYANLAGVEPVDTYIPDYGMYGLGKEPERSIEYLPIEQNTESGSSAGGIYRQMNAGTNPLGIFYYKAVYTFAPDTPAGIYRLALMPWRGRETTSEGTRYQVAPEDWHLVVEEGRFVTVVIDDEAPGGSGSLEITGHGYSGKDGDLMGYNFTRDNSFLNINPHFSSIHDNGLTNGIRLEDSSPDKPWTMDNWDKLRWQWRIIQGETVIHNSDEWLPMGTSSAQFNVSSFTVTTPNPYRTIQTRFRDDLGNTSDWEDRAGIRYTDPRNSLPVSNLSAVYQENNNVIIVSWTTPTLMDGAKIYLNGAALPENDLPRNEGQTSYDYIITGVPRINSDGIKNGEKVKNVIEHTITVFAYKDNVEAEDDKETIIIWNIPGMSVSEANPLIPISDYSDLSQIVLGDPKVQYVLTKDIDVYERWIPLGSRDTNTDAFRGKLYGNGNKITIANGFVEGLYQNNSNQYYGLFGYIQEATIRDLEVEYSNSPYLKIDAAIITSRYGYYGGLVGFMGGTSANNGSKITNCIVRGEENKDVTLEISSSNGTLYTGGMVGLIEVSSIIDNCYSGINVKSTLTGGNNNMWAGGLAGHVKSFSTDSTRIIQGGYATGNVEATNTNTSTTTTTNNLYAGGLIGQSVVKLIDSYAKGNVETEIAITTIRNSNHHAGGLVGKADRSVDKSYAKGKVSVLNRGVVYAGGLIGSAESISNSYAIGDVKTIGDSNTHYVGGLVGNVNGGSVDKSHATGKVNVHNWSTVFAGGLIGIANQAVSNSYATGKLKLKSDTSGITAGGLIGQIGGDIINCYATGNIDATSAGTNVGGLFGESFSSRQIIIDKCYATGDVNAISDGYTGSNNITINAGGLAGGYNNHVSQSWAKGNVTVKTINNSQVIIRAGGFIGATWFNIDDSINIINCYALGNVDVDHNTSINRNLYAGGFIGWSESGGRSPIFTNCFAKGNVEVNSAIFVSTSANVGYGRAGGFAGEVIGDLINVAALGQIVTLTRGNDTTASSSSVYRIAHRNAAGTTTNNHALSSMQIGISYGGYGSTVTKNEASSLTAHNEQNGASVLEETTRDAAFWTNTMGFDTAVWDMSGIGAARNYPLLRGDASWTEEQKNRWKEAQEEEE